MCRAMKSRISCKVIGKLTGRGLSGTGLAYGRTDSLTNNKSSVINLPIVYWNYLMMFHRLATYRVVRTLCHTVWRYKDC